MYFPKINLLNIFNIVFFAYLVNIYLKTIYSWASICVNTQISNKQTF